MTVRQLPPASEHRRIEGFGKQALETGRNRLLVTAAVIAIAFAGIGARLVDLAVIGQTEQDDRATLATQPPPLVSRADIVDRNGVVLASSLPTASLYADPSEVIDPEDAARKIADVFPDVDADKLAKHLAGDGRFIWVKRNLSPEQQLEANRLGLPGFDFIEEERRIYPHGPLNAHVLGATDIDGNGVSGVEAYFDQRLRQSANPLSLSLDVRVQSILRAELSAAVTEFKALGGAGVVFDVRTGETVGLVSLPDFDPNDRSTYVGEARFNRATKGVYEMGSTFKLFTAAMALDTGTVDMQGGYDATQPIRIARFTISDYHAEKRWLSLPEIIVHSSNIGAAKMAVDVGGPGQQAYLKKFGLMRDAALELPEIGHPLTPSTWREINTMTISYGHGIAVTPVQLTAAIGSLVNGGMLRPATLLKHEAGAPVAGERILSNETSDKMRQLMRLVVAKGTGRKADAPGYFVGGKTGTAEKQFGGVYKKKALMSSFVGAFPIQDPRYVVFAMIDEPVGNKRTFNYATGGWVAAPVVKRVVSQIGPLLGIVPAAIEDEPLPLPPIDDERLKPKIATDTMVKKASVSAGVVRPANSVKPPASIQIEAPPPPPLPKQTAKPPPQPPVNETPDERIARKTREALEQAFAAQ
ncbi:MAG: penicillin-binding protein 2 [Rhodospirillales bacterium]|nr:penicillin-binding protein 2 [Rhodospirillales bacterium]